MEMRDVEKDVSIPDSSEEHEIIAMQKEVSYISYYWSDVVSKLDEKIKGLELSFDVWFVEAKNTSISRELSQFTDQKEKNQFIKGLSVSSIKDLVIKHYKDEYVSKKQEIIEVEKIRDKFEGVIKAIEKKHFQLSSLAKNYQMEVRTTQR